MAKFELIPESQLEPLAYCLGDCGTGNEISLVLSAVGLTDRSGESTKWRRLLWIFLQTQRDTRSSNQIFAFIQAFLDPVRFIQAPEHHSEKLAELNKVLSFMGTTLGKDGDFRNTSRAKTIDEAERRFQTIQSKFKGRRLHPELLKYCKAELMQKNYFHAVFESSKGLAQRIRDLSGADGDRAKLVDKVFSIERPILALNSLLSEAERNEHKGFAQLLKGCFAAVRNPLAHEPKILWRGEDDAADYFSLISLLHRKLDDCFKIPTA